MAGSRFHQEQDRGFNLDSSPVPSKNNSFDTNHRPVYFNPQSPEIAFTGINASAEEINRILDPLNPSPQDLELKQDTTPPVVVEFRVACGILAVTQDFLNANLNSEDPLWQVHESLLRRS